MKTEVSRPLFSVREIVTLLVVVMIGMPIAVFLPFIVMKLLGFDIAGLGLTTKSFAFYVLLSQCAGLVIALGVVYKRLKKRQLTWQEVGLRKAPVGKSLKYIAGYYGVAFVSVIALAILLTALGAKSGGESSASESAMFGALWLNIVITVVLTPIIEEILFRGIILERLLQTRKPVYAIIVGALIFAFAHLDPVRIVMLLPLAFYISFMYYRLRSIYPGMILHASWNLLVLLLQR